MLNKLNLEYFTTKKTGEKHQLRLYLTGEHVISNVLNVEEASQAIPHKCKITALCAGESKRVRTNRNSAMKLESDNQLK